MGCNNYYIYAKNNSNYLIPMKSALHILFDADSLAGRFLSTLIYILLYDFIYEEYIYGVFGYIGDIDYRTMDSLRYISWIILSILPMCFYHKINNISTFLCLFVYVLVYIPMIHALFVIDGIPTSEIYSYAIILCFFFILYFQIHKIPLLKGLQIKPTLSLQVIEIITLLLTIIFIVSRASSMHFVNIFTQIDLLYELRADNSSKVEERSLILYIQGWLTGAFYPFLLVWYLKNKSRIKTGLILIGYLLIFMVDMQKSTFLIPFMLIGFYLLIKWKEQLICNRLHSFIFWSLIIFSWVMMGISDSDNKIIFTISSFLLLRTICVTGWLTQMYIHFFHENPFTYYSHIHIVNAITNNYPYDVPLGMAVAYNSQNANATFFLTEGVASWGFIGVIITGFIFLLLLYLLDSVTLKYKKSEIFIIFIPALFSMLNTSIFSTFLTGGLFIVIILFASFEPQKRGNKRNMDNK